MPQCCCNDDKCLSRPSGKKDFEQLLEKIIKIESDMFVSVNDGGDKADCQSQLKTFHAMRYMSFAVLSYDTLQSYFEDLNFAVQDGRNLVKEKYARMDNLIPVFNENPAIDKIVEIESEWMKELHDRYPHAIQYSQQFSNYEHSELETYSDETLELYLKDVTTAKLAKINLIESRYKILYGKMGFKSLEEVENKAVAK